jgi:hypothetical protein
MPEISFCFNNLIFGAKSGYRRSGLAISSPQPGQITQTTTKQGPQRYTNHKCLSSFPIACGVCDLCPLVLQVSCRTLNGRTPAVEGLVAKLTYATPCNPLAFPPPSFPQVPRHSPAENLSSSPLSVGVVVHATLTNPYTILVAESVKLLEAKQRGVPALSVPRHPPSLSYSSTSSRPDIHFCMYSGCEAFICEQERWPRMAAVTTTNFAMVVTRSLRPASVYLPRPLSFAFRHFGTADPPGHEQYTPN